MEVPANGYAYVAPNDQPSTMQMLQYLAERNKQRKLEEQQQLQRQQENELKLNGMVQKAWSDNGVNSVLHDQQQALMNKYTEMVQKHPNISPAALQSLMMDDINKLKTYNDNVNNVYNVVKKQQEAYKGVYKNINHSKAGDLAIENMLYTTDANGKKVLRSADDIKKDVDSGKDFYMDAIDQHPDLLLSKPPSVDESLSYVKPSLKKDSYKVVDKKGGYTDKSYSVNMYPFQNVINDKNGEVSLQTRHDVYDPVTGKMVQPGDNTAGRGSMPTMPVAKQEDYDAFMSRLDNKMLVNSQLKSRLADVEKMAGHKIDPKSEEADLLRRNIVYDILDSKTRGTQLSTDVKEKDDPIHYGRGGSGSGSGMTAEQKKEVKDQQKLDSKYNPVNIFHGAFNGTDYDNEAPDVKINIGNGKTRNAKNLTPLLPNSFDVVLPTGQQVKPEAVYFFPDNRKWGFTVAYKAKDENNDDVVKTVRIAPDQMKQFVSNSMRKNSGDAGFDKISKYISSKYDQPTEQPQKKESKSTPVQNAVNKVTNAFKFPGGKKKF